MKIKVPSENFYELRLEHGFGSLPVRFLDCTPPGWISQFYFMVYREWRDSGDLKDVDFLLNPLVLMGMPNATRKGSWRHLEGVHDSRIFELPDEKQTPWIVTGYDGEINSLREHWRVCYMDLALNKVVLEDVRSYAQVAHLEEERIISPAVIRTRATMEVIKLSGESIEQYYDVLDPWTRLIYLESIDVPFMKDIPEKFRGRALTESEASKLARDQKRAIPFRSEQANPAPILMKSEQL